MALFDSSKITAMHEGLNSKAIAPSKGYRRNVVVYELLCYVNNIIACYVSKNEEPIPVFIGRARDYLSHAQPSEAWGNYYAYVAKYLNEMEAHLIENGTNTNYL
jgi:hypothetical protein